MYKIYNLLILNILYKKNNKTLMNTLTNTLRFRISFIASKSHHINQEILIAFVYLNKKQKHNEFP